MHEANLTNTNFTGANKHDVYGVEDENLGLKDIFTTDFITLYNTGEMELDDGGGTIAMITKENTRALYEAMKTFYGGK